MPSSSNGGSRNGKGYKNKNDNRAVMENVSGILPIVSIIPLQNCTRIIILMSDFLSFITTSFAALVRNTDSMTLKIFSRA